MIEHKINSERSIEHWTYFNPSGKNVLDLGCGRHDTHNIQDHSPTFFLSQGASLVVGVDAREGEIEYYNSLNLPNFIVYQTFVSQPEDITSLIQEYNINAIKCDIEEYETVLYKVSKEEMNNIIELAIEYHNIDIRENIIKKINEWGFNIIAEGKFAFVHAPQMGVLYCTKNG